MKNITIAFKDIICKTTILYLTKFGIDWSSNQTKGILSKTIIKR